MTRRARLVVKLFLILLILYAAIVAIFWFAQERLIFPAYLVVPALELPPDAERLTVETPDGVRLEGVHIPPAAGASGGNTLLLVFAGNATNAQGAAELIHELHPGHPVVAFFYLGYAPNGGVAGARQLMDDAPLVHDLVVQRLRPRRVFAVGISLGSGVAAALAAHRPLDGLILVTPFDSLAATARDLHPWLPVSLLIRHDMRSAELLRGTRLPVAIIASGNDRLVRRERTEVLRRAIPNLVFDVTIPGASHDDIFLRPELEPAMREALARIGEAS